MVGMVHGISHALGGIYHIPHGLANALVLPEVMDYNLDAQLDRYSDVAMALGITFPQIVHESQSLLKAGKFKLFENFFTVVDSLRPWMDTQSYKAQSLAAKAIGNLNFIDQWFRKWSASAAIEKIRTINRRLAFITGMPLNLKDAGITDNLARLEQVASTAMEDGAMLYNPVEPEKDAVVEIVKKLYHSKITPLPVTKKDLKPSAAKAGKKELKDVFKDSEMLYEVLIEFYEQLKVHPKIGPALKKTNLCVQFVYKNPSGIITIDARGDELIIHKGEFDGKSEVTMTMNADFAHKFWLGKANLVTALTRRQVVAKGNVPKTLKLLPILNPAYALYPEFLKEKGLGHLVITYILLSLPKDLLNA